MSVNPSACIRMLGIQPEKLFGMDWRGVSFCRESDYNGIGWLRIGTGRGVRGEAAEEREKREG